MARMALGRGESRAGSSTARSWATPPVGILRYGWWGMVLRWSIASLTTTTAGQSGDNYYVVLIPAIMFQSTTVAPVHCRTRAQATLPTNQCL